MGHSFEGIGQWAATFACGGAVQEGQVVKISGGGTVSPCGDGDKFCGTAVAVGRDGGACSVALGGMVTVSFSGAAPALGWTALSADGKGGVKADSGGRVCLVADVDAAGKCVTVVL